MLHVDATLDWTAGLRPVDAPRTHRTSARGLVTDADGRILFTQTGDGHLMLPGGGIENGESDVDCIRREVAEETGMVVEAVGELLGTCTELNPDRDGASIWALECRYRAATTNGETVSTNLSEYELKLELRPAWLTPTDAIAACRPARCTRATRMLGAPRTPHRRRLALPALTDEVLGRQTAPSKSCPAGRPHHHVHRSAVARWVPTATSNGAGARRSSR